MCSFTPSRMGIITSRLAWSKPSVESISAAGVSLGNSGYLAGGEVCARDRAMNNEAASSEFTSTAGAGNWCISRL